MDNYGPGLISPLTTIFGHMQVIQRLPDNRCRDIEYATADCVEAYGFNRGKEKCKTLISDLLECIYHVKQDKRLELMHIEYLHQMKTGQKKEFIPYPRVNYFYV